MDDSATPSWPGQPYDFSPRSFPASVFGGAQQLAPAGPRGASLALAQSATTLGGAAPGTWPVALPTDVPAPYPYPYPAPRGDDASCSARSSTSGGSWEPPSSYGSVRSPSSHGAGGRKLIRLSSAGSSAPMAADGGLLSSRSSEDEDRAIPRRSRSCQDVQRLCSDGKQRNSCLAMQELHRARRGTCPGATAPDATQHGSSAALELLCSMDEDELESFVRTPSQDLVPVYEDRRF